jgi:hypothetical protein
MVDAKNLKTPKQRLSDVATWNANNFNSAGYNNNNSNNINSNNNNNNHIGKSDYKADLSKNRADYLNNASDYNTIDNKTDHIGHHIGTGILSEISTPENTVRKPINIVLSDAQSRVNTIDNLRNKLGTIKLNQQNGTLPFNNNNNNGSNNKGNTLNSNQLVATLKNQLDNESRATLRKQLLSDKLSGKNTEKGNFFVYYTWCFLLIFIILPCICRMQIDFHHIFNIPYSVLFYIVNIQYYTPIYILFLYICSFIFIHN